MYQATKWSWAERRMPFLNTEIDNVTMKEAVSCVRELALKGTGSYVVTPNVDHIVKLEKDQAFAEVYAHADLILTDGKPLVWISHWLHTPIVEKVSGSDLFPLVCEMAAKEKLRVYFLGAAPGVAAKAAEVLKEKYEDLNVAGTFSPAPGFEKDPQQITEICEMLQQAKPDILFLGLGSPKQEILYYKIRERLHIPVTLHIGASFDFVAGNIRRAPKWMSNIGLEWLYRLCREPKRMFKRYIVDDMQIFRIYLKYRK